MQEHGSSSISRPCHFFTAAATAAAAAGAPVSSTARRQMVVLQAKAVLPQTLGVAEHIEDTGKVSRSGPISKIML